jgi:probable F420-dependent oxidoreductase
VQEIVELAQFAEALGYHSVWGNDHMTTQHYVREEFEQSPRFWEVLITLSYIAAETTTLGLATGVLVPAMRRDIVIVAKQVATLDHFSNGRVLLGMGVGAYREEFEALNPGWKVHRGDLLEESVQALQRLFSQSPASWEGAYHHFQDVDMFPKPVQEPLPIYIGGNNANAVRRTALYGQGWMGAGMPASQLAAAVNRLRQIASENGRNADEIDVAPQFVACIGNSHEQAMSHFQNSQMFKHLVSLSGTTLKDQVAAGFDFAEIDLIGTADEIIEKVEALRQAGATHISGLLFPANSVAELRDQMQQFAEDVMAHVQPEGSQ